MMSITRFRCLTPLCWSGAIQFAAVINGKVVCPTCGGKLKRIKKKWFRALEKAIPELKKKKESKRKSVNTSDFKNKVIW